eukprot:gene509-8022_t
MQLTRTRAIVLCSATVITTGIFIMAGLLFIIFAVSNSSYDSIQIHIKNYQIEKNCFCEGKAYLRGKSYFKLEYSLNFDCKQNCQPILKTNRIKGLVSYLKDQTHGVYLWHLTIATFNHPNGYFQKKGFIGVGSTDSIQISNTTAISVNVNIS